MLNCVCDLCLRKYVGWRRVEKVAARRTHELPPVRRARQESYNVTFNCAVCALLPVALGLQDIPPAAQACPDRHPAKVASLNGPALEEGSGGGPLSGCCWDSCRRGYEFCCDVMRRGAVRRRLREARMSYSCPISAGSDSAGRRASVEPRSDRSRTAAAAARDTNTAGAPPVRERNSLKSSPAADELDKSLRRCRRRRVMSWPAADGALAE